MSLSGKQTESGCSLNGIVAKSVLSEASCIIFGTLCNNEKKNLKKTENNGANRQNANAYSSALFPNTSLPTLEATATATVTASACVLIYTVRIALSDRGPLALRKTECAPRSMILSCSLYLR